MSQLYFKITNEKECHNGFQYVDGLNILQGEFNNNPKASCVPGRLYFSDSENICKFLNYGVYLREVTLPTDNSDFQMLKDPEGNKYGACMIILGDKHDLRDPDTWKFMISVGINIHAYNYYALKWASFHKYLKVLQFLVENGADIHVDNDYSLRCALNNDHFEMVKYLVEKGANIHVNNDYSLIMACKNGNFEMAKYLIEKGVNVNAKSS
uniref:Ankyrin repeat-containing protein n=1 Tax=Borely moumouvirus TaxID=2712067 RepID=A0A6G6ACT1_9VIRU